MSEHRKAPAFNTQCELSVQLRIQAAHNTSRTEKLSAGRWFLIGQVILMALLASPAPGNTSVGTLQLLSCRSCSADFAWFAAKPEPLTIHALGKSELVYASAFGVLLVLGMRLP